MILPKIINVERKISTWCSHLGFAIFLLCITFGYSHIQQLTMALAEGQTECRAHDGDGRITYLDFNIRLNSFKITPENYVSEIDVLLGDEMAPLTRQISVNHPLKVDDWQIYQYDYAKLQDDAPPVTVLMLVRDPWLPYLYVGIFLLLGGAVLSLAQPRKLLYVGIVGLTIIILKYTYFDHVTTPALRSSWFAPHVGVYMGCYLAITLAVLLAVYQLVIKRKNVPSVMRRMDFLVALGLPLMTIGMLFGALWAKQSWGICWSWDPKESFALATWLLFLIYSHLRRYKPTHPALAITVLVVAFLTLQMCWWGINYLPSLQASSLHVYDI